MLNQLPKLQTYSFVYFIGIFNIDTMHSCNKLNYFDEIKFRIKNNKVKNNKVRNCSI